MNPPVVPLVLSGVYLTHGIANEVGRVRKLNVYKLVGEGIVTFLISSFIEKHVDAVACCCLRSPCVPDCRFSVLMSRVGKEDAGALRPIVSADLRYQQNHETHMGGFAEDSDTSEVGRAAAGVDRHAVLGSVARSFR